MKTRILLLLLTANLLFSINVFSQKENELKCEDEFGPFWCHNFTCSPGENIGYEKTVTVSSSLNSHLGPDNIVDCNLASLWISGKNNTEEYLSMDLGALYEIKSAHIIWGTGRNIDGIKVYISDDGITWEGPIYEENLLCKRSSEIKIYDECRYIKVICTKEHPFRKVMVREMAVYPVKYYNGYFKNLKVQENGSFEGNVIIDDTLEAGYLKSENINVLNGIFENITVNEYGSFGKSIMVEDTVGTEMLTSNTLKSIDGEIDNLEINNSAKIDKNLAVSDSITTNTIVTENMNSNKLATENLTVNGNADIANNMTVGDTLHTKQLKVHEHSVTESLQVNSLAGQNGFVVPDEQGNMQIKNSETDTFTINNLKVNKIGVKDQIKIGESTMYLKAEETGSIANTIYTNGGMNLYTTGSTGNDLFIQSKSGNNFNTIINTGNTGKVGIGYTGSELAGFNRKLNVNGDIGLSGKLFADGNEIDFNGLWNTNNVNTLLHTDKDVRIGNVSGQKDLTIHGDLNIGTPDNYNSNLTIYGNIEAYSLESESIIGKGQDIGATGVYGYTYQEDGIGVKGFSTSNGGTAIKAINTNSNGMALYVDAGARAWQALELHGKTYFNGDMELTGNMTIEENLEVKGNIIGTGAGLWEERSNSDDIYRSAGKVGLGDRPGHMYSRLNVFAEGNIYNNPGEHEDCINILGDMNNQGLVLGVDGDAGDNGLGRSYIQSYKLWQGTDHYHLILNPHGGNVGIGCINPNAKLSVNGIIRAKELLLSNPVPGCDFVFEEDYKLSDLEKVEQYIKRHKHLPGVRSADEFKANGYNVGEMDNILLLKIEELTLYTIEQQKKIKQLNAKNEMLKKQIEVIDALEKRIEKLENH